MLNEDFIDRMVIGKTPSITFTSKFEPLPEKYIINGGATILFWKDGTKTIVKLSDGDTYDKRLGFLIAYFQHISGLSKTKANKYLSELKEEAKKTKKEDRNATFEFPLSEEDSEEIIKMIDDALNNYEMAKAHINKAMIGEVKDE